MSKLELAYLAGFFDGEGCISCSPSVNNRGDKHPGATYQLIVCIAQNDGNALVPFAKRWGGKIGKRTRGVNNDDCCLWSVGGHRALACLTDLHPYLRAKKAEASIALKWPFAKSVGRGHVTPPNVLKKREDIYFALRDIKQNRKQAILPSY